MIYNDLIQILKDSATAVNPAGMFVHGDSDAISHDTVNGALPLIAVTLVNEVKQDHFCQTTFAMLFASQDSKQNNPDKRDPSITSTQDIISTMRELCYSYIEHLDDNNDDISISQTSGTKEENVLLGEISGFSIQYTITHAISC